MEAQPFQGKKKGADTGIDGVKFFRDLDRKELRKIVVSVRGGGIKQLHKIEALLDNTQRAEHPDYEPDLNFKKAKGESDVEQQTLI